MSVNLPDSKGQDVALVQPTSQEVLEILHQNSQEWKGALSLEAYIRREDFLNQQPLMRDGGLTPWALVCQTDYGRKVLASCETIRKKALVARNGKVNEVICHGVASVFCSPEYRGKGYAGRMIKELGQALKDWQTDGNHECLFSVLYSDIGKQFYTSHGWTPFPSAHVSLSPSKGPKDSSLPEAKPLYADDLARLCVLDEDLTRKELTAMASAGKTAVAIVPDMDTLAWHFAREEFVSKELCGESPDIRGAIVGTEVGKRVWCAWTRMRYNPDPQNDKDNTLYIMRLVVEDPEYSDVLAATEKGAEKVKGSYVSAATASLLAAAQAEASKWKMEVVETWNPTSATLAAARMLDSSAQIIHRDKASIASLKWYGDGSGQEVDWIKNEKYAWC